MATPVVIGEERPLHSEEIQSKWIPMIQKEKQSKMIQTKRIIQPLVQETITTQSLIQQSSMRSQSLHFAGPQGRYNNLIGYDHIQRQSLQLSRGIRAKEWDGVLQSRSFGVNHHHVPVHRAHGDLLNNAWNPVRLNVQRKVGGTQNGRIDARPPSKK